MIFLMSFSACIRMAARRKLGRCRLASSLLRASRFLTVSSISVSAVSDLKLSGLDRRVVVWPTYRGLILTEVARVFKEKSALRPLITTPRTSSAQRTESEAKEREAGEAEAYVSGAQRKRNRPVIGVDVFNPTNIR
jgi:hypothetical protein